MNTTNRFLCKAKVAMDGGTKKEGEWIVGFYSAYIEDDGTLLTYVTDVDDAYEVAIVMPNTVCQCTGIKDKNDDLIYEGDYLVTDNHPMDKGLVHWLDGAFRCGQVSITHNWMGKVSIVGNVFEESEN